MGPDFSSVAFNVGTTFMLELLELQLYIQLIVIKNIFDLFNTI